MLSCGTVAPRRWLSGALRARLAACLIGLVAAGNAFSSPAAAVSTQPPALLDWLRARTAPAKAAEQGSARLSGLPALNGNLSRSFNRLRRAGPDWLDRVDVGVNLQGDLTAAYRVGFVQPLLRTRASESALEARTWLAYDAVGNRTGHLGINYHASLQDERFAASLFTRAEENWRNHLWRYVFGGNVGWAGVRLHAHFIDKVAREIAGREQRFKEAVDSYVVEVSTGLPVLPWARVRARKFWDAAPRRAGIDTEGYSFRLWLQPIRPLVVETGTNDTNRREPDWFAGLRLRLKFN